MVKLRALIICFIFIVLTSPVFADKYFTVKLYGGWNSWISESFGRLDYLKGSYSGGYLFGMDFLIGSPTGIQYGIETSYLSMFIQSYEGFYGSLGLIPVTADLVVNEGILYTDFGLGAAFPIVTDSFRSTFYQNHYYTTNVNNTEPVPGILAKIGCGINFPITDFIGLDAGITMYMTFSNFGIGLQYYNELLVNIFYYSQYNIRAGVNFYF